MRPPVARQPISRNESQSVRKCTASSDRSILIARVRPPTGAARIVAQVSARGAERRRENGAQAVELTP